MLEVISLNNSDKWDSLVRSFNQYDTYWLSGYVRAFRSHGDGEPLLFYYIDNVTRGINVVMKRDVADDERFHGKIPAGQYFDIATPYGYGGWIIEGSKTEKLFDEYEKWLQKNGIICEFVRFHPLLQNHESVCSFYNVVQLGEVVHMDLTSPEEIWNNLTSKNRNMIRKALNNNVMIYNGRFPEIYERFREIYNNTMNKDGAKQYYYFSKDFYTSLLDDLPQNAQVFWAEKDNRIVAASIILASNGRMNYHLSGSIQEYNSIAPTNLLLYKVALWGCANGYQSFYLGGGVGSGQDSLFRFKRSFYRGELNHFHIGSRIYDQEKYDVLSNLRSQIDNTAFFPKYRG